MANQRILLHDIFHFVAGDGTRARDIDLLIEGPRVVAVGPNLPRDGAKKIDCSTKLVMPGLVNAHHHMFQAPQRCVRRVQNSGLFDWLRGLYPIWLHMTEQVLVDATQLACVELLKTGCTATMDHHYLFSPSLAAADLVAMQFDAAGQVGIRFCASRGSMSRGVSAGGLPPDEVVEDEAAILKDSERALRFHDDTPFSMRRVALAPCAPFNVSPELMEQSAQLARSAGVHLHTHLAETADEADYCAQTYGCTPLELMDRIGWLGPDVWFAHGVHFSDADLDMLAQTRTGVVHCASSNMRLGSGTCRVPEMVQRGIRVGLGVDGSASNDSSDMLGELRNCLLLHRCEGGASALTVEDVFALATRGSADLLGWKALGVLEPDRPADLAIVQMDAFQYAGALDDPLAALVMCGYAHTVDTTIVNGEVVLENGCATRVDETALVQRINEHAYRMLQRAGIDSPWMPKIKDPR